jgi:hypothetical protein
MAGAFPSFFYFTVLGVNKKRIFSQPVEKTKALVSGTILGKD